MGWFVVIVIAVIIIAAALKSHSGTEDSTESSESTGKTYVFDDQDPDNPLYEEMQEEFFDEFEW